MLTCLYFEKGECIYPEPCSIQMALANEELQNSITKIVKANWDLCKYRYNSLQYSVTEERIMG